MYITAHDKTYGSYLEFGVFTGSSFNFAMKVNKNLDKLLGNSNCDFVVLTPFKDLEKLVNQMSILCSKMRHLK